MKVKYVSATVLAVFSMFCSKAIRARSISPLNGDVVESSVYSPIPYTRAQVKEFVLREVIETTGREQISEEDYLVNTLGYDSIGLYNLIVACSEYFDIQIQIAQALLASTEQKVGEFITMIHNYCIQEAARHNNQ